MAEQLLFGQTGVDKVARLELKQMVLGPRVMMRDLLADGVWFTSALTLTSFRIPSDPLADFLARRPEDWLRVFMTRTKLFNGIGSERMKWWDYALFWCPKEGWEYIGSHLANCVFKDGEQQTYTKWMQGSVLDVPACDMMPAGAEPYRVEVAVLGMKAPTWEHEISVPEERWLPLQVTRKPL